MLSPCCDTVSDMTSPTSSSPTLRRLERLADIERQRLARHVHSHTAPAASSPRESLVHRLESATRYPLALGGVAWLALLISLTTSAGGSSVRVAFFIVWGGIAGEYVVRITLASHRTTYLRQRWLEPVALIAPPLLLTHVVGIDKAVVAIETAAIRIRGVLLHHSLVRVFLASGVVLVMGAWVIDLSERHLPASNIHSFGTALWWAVVTVTTVGYGDHFPMSGAGQVVAGFMMVMGIGLIGTLTATVASAFVKDHTDDVTTSLQSNHLLLIERFEEMAARLKDIEKRLGATDEEIADVDRAADELAKSEDLEL